MGGKQSAQEKKTVETNGSVNNNFVIEDSVQIHNKEMMVILYIICAIKIFELLLYIYKSHTKRIRKGAQTILPTTNQK